MTKQSGPIRCSYRPVPHAASRVVQWMLAVPPLIILAGLLFSGGPGTRSQSGENVWHFSPAHMEERTRVVRNVILPEVGASRIVVEMLEGYNADGSWRGMWKANVFDRHDGFLLTATWEDATGELIQLSRSTRSTGGGRGGSSDVSHKDTLQSSMEAGECAREWVGKLGSVRRRSWKVEEPGREGTCWRVYLSCPEGRMLIQMEAKTGRPIYLSFRPSSFPSMRGIE